MLWKRSAATVVGFAMLSVVACAKSERMPVSDLVKQVAADARTKLRVQVTIRASADEATTADKALLRSLEDAIERQKVGRLVSSGTQPGEMFITVEVENTADAIATLQSILQKAGVRDRASFKVIQSE
jgi:AMMECR1 domain-containing protein